MGTTRQLIFGIDPYGNEPLIQTLEFAQVPDANLTGKAFTCGVVPKARSSGVSLMQETVFLGTTSAVGKTFQALVDTLAEDDGETVTATAVTQRIDPDARADGSNFQSVTQKRYLTINFNGNSVIRTGASASYCLDGDPISGDPLTWVNFLGTTGDTKLSFDGAKGNFAHLRFIDASNSYHEVAVPPFCVEYISEGVEREGRDD
jgi:hypothetical protein